MALLGLTGSDQAPSAAARWNRRPPGSEGSIYRCFSARSCRVRRSIPRAISRSSMTMA